MIQVHISDLAKWLEEFEAFRVNIPLVNYGDQAAHFIRMKLAE